MFCFVSNMYRDCNTAPCHVTSGSCVTKARDSSRNCVSTAFQGPCNDLTWPKIGTRPTIVTIYDHQPVALSYLFWMEGSFTCYLRDKFTFINLYTTPSTTQFVVCTSSWGRGRLVVYWRLGYPRKTTARTRMLQEIAFKWQSELIDRTTSCLLLTAQLSNVTQYPV